MQKYAEDAVTEHLKELQGYFFKEKKGAKKAPYTFRLTQEQVDEILDRAMRLSDRPNKCLYSVGAVRKIP